MQRLARFTIQQENQQAIQLLSQYDQLMAIITRHLPPSTATIFARPEIKEDGKVVEWYSDLQGQPYLLKEDIADQQKWHSVQPLLETRLNAIKQLNHTLSQQGQLTPEQSNLLTQLVDGASHDTKQIYLINNDPVIVGWGVGKKPVAPPPPPPAVAPVNHRWCWWLLPLLLLLLALLLWWYFFLRSPEKVPEPVKSAPVITQPNNSVTQTPTPPVVPEPAQPKEQVPTTTTETSIKQETVPEKNTALPAQKVCKVSSKPGENPQMVIVFDNSSSMLYSLLENRQNLMMFEQRWMYDLASPEEIAYMRRSPNRLEVAKKSSASIINNIAKSVDIGLVELRGCPSAISHGFYSPNQRQRLRTKINAMYPEPDTSHFGGTPLYSGLKKAANMVDGRQRDAFILLLSDGEDSCQSPNICALAQQIARKQPKLKINVVDIGGAQAANCVANATGGKVFTATDQKQLINMINQAVKPFTEEVICQ